MESHVVKKQSIFLVHDVSIYTLKILEEEHFTACATSMQNQLAAAETVSQSC